MMALDRPSSTTAGGRRSTVRTLEVAGLRVVTAPIVARGSTVGKSLDDGMRDPGAVMTTDTAVNSPSGLLKQHRLWLECQHRIRKQPRSPSVSATPRVLRNFVNGASADPETDATTDIIN